MGNEFFVGVQGESLILLVPPMPNQRLSRESALNLAAWLVALADVDDEFGKILADVKAT